MGMMWPNFGLPHTILLKFWLCHDIFEFYRYPASDLGPHPSGWVFADILTSAPQLLRAGSSRYPIGLNHNSQIGGFHCFSLFSDPPPVGFDATESDFLSNKLNAGPLWDIGASYNEATDLG